MSGGNKSGTGGRLLIVDDHRICREGLQSLFEKNRRHRIAACGTGNAAAIAEEFSPAVALLGITPPGYRALKTGSLLLGLAKPPAIVFLDQTFRPVHLREAIALGARGYRTRHISFDRLAEAVRCVAGGSTSFCSQARPYLVKSGRRVRFHPPADTVTVTHLSRREAEVLLLLGEGMNVDECARKMQLSPNTVDNHRTRMKRRLGFHKLADVIRLAYRDGLLK